MNTSLMIHDVSAIKVTRRVLDGGTHTLVLDFSTDSPDGEVQTHDVTIFSNKPLALDAGD